MTTIVEAPDLESAEDLLRRAYSRMTLSGRGQVGGLRYARTSLGALHYDRLHFSLSFDADVDPLGTLAFVRVVGGRISHDGRPGDVSTADAHVGAYRSGDVYLSGAPEAACHVSVDALQADVVVLDPAVVDQVVDAAAGLRPAPVRFTGHDVASAAGRQQWAALHAYLQADPEAMVSPLGAGTLARVVAGLALATLPSTAATQPTARDRTDAHPASLRRAVSFIDANAHRDISPADVATAARVSIRTLQVAFRRHRGTSPGGYLRRVRLDRAHAELRAAVLGDGTRLVEVAARWGYLRLDRFSADYHGLYGVYPHQTLRQSTAHPPG